MGGVVITAVAAYLREARTLKAAETQRWDERLLELSVELLDSCNRIAPRNSFAGNYIEVERRKGVNIGAEALATHNALTRIQLLGPQKLHRRAENLHHAALAYFAQPIDENRTGHDQVFSDLKEAYDGYIDELKSVLSARRGKWYQRKPKSLAAKRGAVTFSSELPTTPAKSPDPQLGSPSS